MENEYRHTDFTELAKTLNYNLKNYEGLTKQIVQTTNRAHSYDIDPAHEAILHGERDKSGKMKFQGLEQIKDKQSRKLHKLVDEWPVYSDWLAKIPGIGGYIAAKLIRLYYFKFIAICKDCGADLDDDFICIVCKKKAFGMGNLLHRVELRDFPAISSWWHFMGRHNDGTGKMPKSRKGEMADWSHAGRKTGFDIKEAFNKQDNLYKRYAEKRKAYRRNTHPDATKGYQHNMAWNETVKLFLSHFWQVARTLDGLPLTDPWAIKHGGHDKSSIIAPYYWDGNNEFNRRFTV